jgi:glutaminyl-tRNA synthetase
VPHRPLYDWFIEKLEIFPSNQYEFARLNVSYTVTSKRKLLELVTNGFVSGWDDPRMPTITGLRRRGYTAASVRNFCDRIGVQKRENIIDMSLLEFCIREDLNKTSWRRMAVLDPIKLVITNYTEGREEIFYGENNAEVEGGEGLREIPFSREIWIEREDFMENPSKKFFRLGPGLMVRLKHAYIVKCEDFIKDENGDITEIHCTYIKESKSGEDTSGIHVKGTIHWVSVPHAVTTSVNLYDRLFKVEDPGNSDRDFKEYINSESLQIIPQAYIEADLEQPEIGRSYQFIRKGYFCLDKDSRPDNLIFNRTVSLKDTWAKEVRNA